MEEKEILTEAPAEEEPPVENEEPAQDAPEDEQKDAEKQPEAEHAKGRSRVIRDVLYGLTAVLAIAAAVAVGTVLHVRHMVDKCAETKLSQGLTAEETLRRYFDYWDEGNNVGMQLAALPDANSAASVSKNYVAELDLLCDIKLTGCKKLNEDDFRYSGCFETAAYDVSFTYNSHFGAGDKSMDGEHSGWRFYLARLTEDDDWRIYSVIKQEE
ncbi:MAG: hypothetical protein IJ746_06455 [Ruminococcus sp.]|nr:hypothetical protein [Ruminococcus sp.]